MYDGERRAAKEVNDKNIELEKKRFLSETMCVEKDRVRFNCTQTFGKLN